ncbi:MAG: hypothetical protein WAO33_04270 [Candidatus Nanopelagicales bacterium]|jgi:hypothetical protein|nr:hypothetical protein [Actinomycetes bacterium]MCH9830922.1 hypothetical protein [Actinomycetes bacterium]MCH9841109.1 hypothetical protein [Actinomycetes bacterium]
MPETSESAQVVRAQRVIRAGAILTILGLVATLIAILPLVTDLELSSAWWFLSMITGVGLATVIAGLTMSARSRSSRSTVTRSTGNNSGLPA